MLGNDGRSIAIPSARRLIPFLVMLPFLSVAIMFLWHMFVFPIGLVGMLFGDVIEFIDKSILGI